MTELGSQKKEKNNSNYIHVIRVITIAENNQVADFKYETEEPCLLVLRSF